ncbi:hypothetical protein LSAT2_018650 [Lamellibrachia satsuma]|nr:hypothetical protein LSAT2_018650 [Lamellibrachia satsuma]
MSFFAQLALLLIVALLFLPGRVDGIRCHLCENEPTNEDCNTNVAECADSQNDTCYTMIIRTETFGRRYTKGCTNYNKCRKLEALNSRKTCPYIPSDCIYCCNDKANCNAYNASPTWPSPVWKLSLLLLVSKLALNLTN